eukprot:480034_1
MQYILLLILAFIASNSAQGTGVCPNPGVSDDCDRCGSSDDPHITTLDGLRYDQHTDGCFKYITPCSTDYLPFEVCGCHEMCSVGGGTGHGEGCPSNIRCIRDLHITFFDSSGLPDYEIFIDGANGANPAEDSGPLALGPLVSTTTYFFDVDHTFTYTQTSSVHEFEVFSGSTLDFYAHIRYSPGSLEIFLGQTYFEDITCGLCGLYDHDQSNDFTGASGTVHLLPSAIPYGPVDAATNTLINDFANTYLCNGATTPTDYGCEPTEDDKLCFLAMIDCCQDLWDAIFAGVTWDNDMVDEAAFQANWLQDCAFDACALTLNAVDCDNKGDEFSYAIANVKDTATAVYTVQEPEDDFESNCTAKVCAHGDNEMQLDVSYDSGSNWDLAVASEGDWKQTMTAVINPVDENTVLRFTVTDLHVVGGFIATVQLCGTNGYIFEFYTDEINTYFDVISDSAGDPLLDEFTPFGGNPWGGYVKPSKVECMNLNADWMWNDKKENTMVFDVFFGHHLDILRKLDCVEEVTPAPTMDCCSVFDSVDDYLDQCYCSDTTTAGVVMNKAELTEAIASNGVAMNKAELIDAVAQEDTSGGHSAGVNMIVDDVRSVGNVFEKKLNEEMNEIKHMIYATWVLIFACFVINLGVVNGVCIWNKDSEFKSVHGGHESDDDDAECL